MADDGAHKHCRTACEAHGYWCVVAGAEHATHHTELCVCVWTSTSEENSNDHSGDRAAPDPTGRT